MKASRDILHGIALIGATFAVYQANESQKHMWQTPISPEMVEENRSYMSTAKSYLAVAALLGGVTLYHMGRTR